jgi:hypothetical protein
MKRSIQIFAMVSGFALMTPLVADGTLPFGDGTLPFGMEGELVEIENGREVRQEPAQLVFDDMLSQRLNAEAIELTRATPEALSATSCPYPMVWYDIGGELLIDSGSQPLVYQVEGVCATSRSPGEREVFARRGSSVLTLQGTLTEEFNGIQVFSGRATMSQAGSTLQTYRFELVE